MRLCKKQKEEGTSDDISLDYYSNGDILTSGVGYRVSNTSSWSNDFLTLNWYLSGARDYLSADNQLNKNGIVYWWIAFC